MVEETTSRPCLFAFRDKVNLKSLLLKLQVDQLAALILTAFAMLLEFYWSFSLLQDWA